MTRLPRRRWLHRPPVAFAQLSPHYNISDGHDRQLTAQEGFAECFQLIEVFLDSLRDFRKCRAAGSGRIFDKELVGSEPRLQKTDLMLGMPLPRISTINMGSILS